MARRAQSEEESTLPQKKDKRKRESEEESQAHVDAFRSPVSLLFSLLSYFPLVFLLFFINRDISTALH